MNTFNTNTAPPAWPTQPVADTRTNEQKFHEALRVWQAAKERLDLAKEQEAEARKIAFDFGFADWCKEGTNTVALGNGFTCKGVLKYNYTLKGPEGVETVDAVDNMIDMFSKIAQNEGAFIADRLVKWKPEMSVTEYRLLVERAKNADDVAAQAMLKELNKVLQISEGLPTLSIVEPKAKR